MSDFLGFHKLKPGRIHIFCPGCKRKMSNIQRTEYDPPNAVLAHIYCGKDTRCGAGGWIEGPSAYLTARGRFLTAEETCCQPTPQPPPSEER